MRSAVSLAVFTVVVAAAGAADAQVDRRYVEEPTGGLAMPMVGLSGEHDARAAVVNPGGMALLRGPELALQLELQDDDAATSAGPGFGGYFALSGGGGLLPRFGFGMGFEWLRPARAQLAPDPSEPFRLTTSFALGLGANAGFGLAWHHFISDGALGSRDTVDLGLSMRFGNFLGIGAALRDVATADIAGTPVQRRYELETLVRPFETDRLELAVGGRIGERRRDLDGWTRIVLRAARGVYVTGAVESRELVALESSASMGVREVDTRDLRATLGLEVSFGGFGVGGYATGIRDDRDAGRPLGSTLVLKVSSPAPASVLGSSDRIERVELSGTVTSRELTSLVVRLRAIARDPNAKALIVMFDGVGGGWATLQELRNEIAGVRRAGKKVFAYMVSGTGRDYFIATAADKIYLDPAGGLRLVGLAATTLYFRGAFDHIGVQPQFEKIAEYKSAPEQFTQTGPSEPAGQMYSGIYDSLWAQWVAAVAEGRRLSKEEVQAIVDAGPYTAGDLAKNTKLVDAVAPPEKVSELIVAEIGRPYRVGEPPRERSDRWQRPGVAIIYVDGDITDGKSQTVPLIGRTLAGGETLVAAISAARSDPRVSAIILRIDSPGGSALASELVSREVFATRGVKPILCSLSDVAASGGYFIAAGCDMIFAEPMTITGSIGIFYGKFDVSGLIARLGITTSTQKRGARADAESIFRPWTEEERTMLSGQLQYMYGRFVGAVAEGRKLTKDQVDAAGRGRVYTGAVAQDAKLVDRFGGLGDVLDEAKRRIGLQPTDKVQVYELPKLPSGLLGLLGGLLGVRADAAAPSLLTDLPLLQQLLRGLPPSLLVAPERPQARLLHDIVFE